MMEGDAVFFFRGLEGRVIFNFAVYRNYIWFFWNKFGYLSLVVGFLFDIGFY